ncbi:unnamed protein product, partial [Closterium sp. Naga37s-1]
MTSTELRQLKVASAEFHREQLLEAVGGGKKVDKRHGEGSSGVNRGTYRDDNVKDGVAGEDIEQRRGELEDDGEGDGVDGTAGLGSADGGTAARADGDEDEADEEMVAADEEEDEEAERDADEEEEGDADEEEEGDADEEEEGDAEEEEEGDAEEEEEGDSEEGSGDDSDEEVYTGDGEEAEDDNAEDYDDLEEEGMEDTEGDGGERAKKRKRGGNGKGADTWPAPPTEGGPARKGQQLITLTYPKRFDKDYLQQAMCEWVVATDQAFTVVEHPTFCNMMAAANPKCAVEKVIPSRTTLARQIIRLAGLARIKLMEMLAADGLGLKTVLDIKEPLGIVRDLASFIGLSPKRTTLFEKIQRRADEKARILRLRGDNEALTLSSGQWLALEELAAFLKPFHAVSLAAEGSKYPTISRVVPQFNELLDGLDTLKNSVSSPPSGVMKDCITKAEEKLMEYYSGSSDELWVATFLDPSFKIGYFEMDGEGGDKESERPGGVQHVAAERVLALHSSGGSSSGRGGGAGRKGGAAGSCPAIDSFGGVDGDRRSLRARLEEYRSRQEESVMDEVQIYIDERLGPLGTCPLSYWRCRNDLEGLQAMALDYLAIPATSAARYYFRAGTGGGKRMWNINLPGGGWCRTAAECVARSNTFLGSSTFYPQVPTRIPPFPRFAGFLSSNSSVNPSFHNWNLVRLVYCDGGGYLGTAGRLEVGRGTVLYMDGWKIVQAVIEDLNSKGEIQSATHILFSGTSAGGQAALSLCDRIAATFPWAATKCLCDSGNFIDSKDRMGGNTWRDTITNMVALHKPTWPACQD